MRLHFHVCKYVLILWCLWKVVVSYHLCMFRSSWIVFSIYNKRSHFPVRNCLQGCVPPVLTAEICSRLTGTYTCMTDYRTVTLEAPTNGRIVPCVWFKLLLLLWQSCDRVIIQKKSYVPVWQISGCLPSFIVIVCDKCRQRDRVCILEYSYFLSCEGIIIFIILCTCTHFLWEHHVCVYVHIYYEVIGASFLCTCTFYLWWFCCSIFFQHFLVNVFVWMLLFHQVQIMWLVGSWEKNLMNKKSKSEIDENMSK